MTYFDNITEILSSIEKYPDGENNILPTALYNEGWMLRLVLNWFSKNPETGFRISFNKEARWFSEGGLEPAFAGGEGYTAADGIYGNFTVGTQGALSHKNNVKARGISDIRPEKNCGQFVVIEAKMCSGFSTGITRDGKYNQAARYLACMSHVLHEAKIDINTIKDLAFYVLLPKWRKSNSTINKFLQKEKVIDVVKERLEKTVGCDTSSERVKWFKNAFLPFMEKVLIKPIAWEEILDFIKKADKDAYEILNEFYLMCRRFNGLKPEDLVDLSLLD